MPLLGEIDLEEEIDRIPYYQQKGTASYPGRYLIQAISLLIHTNKICLLSLSLSLS